MSGSDLQSWIGRTECMTDVLRAQPARFMQATLDEKPSLKEGDDLPPLWHWLYFLDAKRSSALGRDAHPKRGGFLPPVALPRRMWAGGRFEFHAPLQIGAAAEKRSEIKSVSEKSGRSGPLCFVTVAHDVWQGGALCVAEEQDLVFREDPSPNAPAPTPAPGLTWKPAPRSIARPVLAIAVVDAAQRLVGVVTVDDVMVRLVGEVGQ